MADTSNNDIKSYDIYNKGYKSGAQAFVFLGPLWIEETSFFQIDRSDTKKPVYGYNDVKYDRLLQGRYLVQGTLGINYVESNYLLKVIKQVQSSLIKDTLQELIVNRKSVLTDTLKNMAREYGLDTEGAEKIEQFAKRLCSEAELASRTNNPLDPVNFELTFIYGDILDTTQSIEIYEGVEVVSSGMRSGNDDNVTMEIYNWTARGMKEVEIPAEKDSYLYGFSKANLLTMAKEVTDQLIEQMLEDPIIDVFDNKHRTKLMSNTMRLGLAGMLHPRTRMFGRNASFIEMVYALELPREFGLKGSETEEIISESKLEIAVKKNNENTATVDKNKDIRLIPPTQEIAATQMTAFDNTLGRLVSINREHTAEKIKAISPVRIEQLDFKLGGSIALPQYKRSDFNIGSFIPPRIVPNDETTPFVYTEKDMDAITYSTLWCCLTGYRGTGNSESSIAGEQPGATYLKEISQPLYSFAYIKEVTAKYATSGDYELNISVPTYIDFLNLDKTTPDSLGKRTEAPFVEITTDDVISFKYDKDRKITSVGKESTDPNDLIFKESIIYADHRVVEVTETLSRDDVLPTATISGELNIDFEHFHPEFFRFTIQNNSPKLASDFHKSLYVVPYVFELKPGEILPNNPDELETGQVIQNLSMLLAARNNNDDSCEYDMDYDWVCRDVSGIQSVDGKVTIDGVYFLNPKTTITEPKEVHVIWIMALLPIKRQDINNQDKPIELIHDISGLGGRHVELYNITRCDTLYHISSNYQLYDPQDNIAEQIVAGLRDIWDTLKNILLNEDYEYNYALPIKSSLDRICGFMDGYAVSMNISNIVDQILKCEFTGGSAVKDYIGKDSGPATLEDALIKAVGKEAAFGIRKDITSIVTGSLYNKIEIKGANIIDDVNTGNIIVEVAVPSPPPDVVSWGLQTNGLGALALLELKDKNQGYKKNPEAPVEESSPAATSLTLGGYSAVI